MARRKVYGSSPNMLEHYGDIVELNYQVDDSVFSDIAKITDWQQEKTRRYIDLIGNTDQDYRGKSEQDLEYNSNIEQMPEIKKLIDKFTGVSGNTVYKARVMELDAGSYFEPHRDHFQGGKRFRILIPLNNTTRDKYAFFYEDKIVEFKPRTPYILNTRKIHGAMCFADKTYHVLMSVNNTDENQRKVIDMITFR